MKCIFLLSMLGLAVSCSSERPKFVKEKVCSNQSLKFLKNPRNRDRLPQPSPDLVRQFADTHEDIQRCYQKFLEHSGPQEINTCLVVGVDESGKRDYFNFSSEEKAIDQEFLNCARSVTQDVPYEKFGKNYILIQAYQFY